MPDRVVKWTQEIRDIHTSMYDDWKAGRPTEIEYLNGYIVDQGRELGHSDAGERGADGDDQDDHREGHAPVPASSGSTEPSFSRCRWTGGHRSSCRANTRSTTSVAMMPSMRGRAITVKGLLDIPALQIDADHVTFHSADGKYAATLTLAAGEGVWVVAVRAGRRAVAGWKRRAVSVDHTRAGRSVRQCEGGGTDRSAGRSRERIRGRLSGRRNARASRMLKRVSNC